MSPAATSWMSRSRGRAWHAVLGVVLVLLAALLVCEALGWPFLAGPLERQLSQRLERDVRFGSESGERDFKLRLLGSVRLSVGELEIGAPSWSKAPHFLQGQGIRLRLPYSGLWQASRGGQLVVSSLEADRLSVYAQRLADGRASWQFGEPREKDREASAPPPRLDRLLLTDGEIHYSDEPLQVDVTAKVSLSEGRRDAGGQGGLRVTASGQYRDEDFQLRLNSAGVLPLLDTGAHAQPVPLQLRASTGGASLSFRGTVLDVLALRGMTGRFSAEGPSLGAAGDLFGLTLPRTGAFSTAGTVVKDQDLWKVVFERAKIGSSELQGAFTYDSAASVPTLAGRLSGQRLVLADLAPAVGAPRERRTRAAETDGKLLPSREFNLPKLGTMNADLRVDIERFDLGSLFDEPLQPLRAGLRLRSGVLAIADIEAATARGRVAGDLSLDGTGSEALWKADLRWSDIRLQQWLAQPKGPGATPYVSGRLAGHAKLRGRGKSTAQILGSLDGDLQSAVTDGSVSHLIVEAVGLDVAQALGVAVAKKDELPLRCAVASMKVNDGVVDPVAVVLDTRDSTIFVSGSVALRSEKLDLKATVEPKDVSPLALRTPVLLQGTLANPQVSLKAAPLAARLGAAALLAMVNPLAALIPLFDVGEGQKGVGCRALLDQARGKKGAGS